jgi:SET domain-containing protein
MCCPYAGICGNGLEPSRHLQLMRRAKTRELTVVATNTIDKGVVIGEYLGRMKSERFTARERPANSGYRMYMHHDPEHPSNQRVCIDAIRFGSLLRYVNHACFANVRFRQVCNRDQHTIVAVTNRRIMPGEEIFANYGDELWFLCRCENINCAHRALIMQNKAKAAREKEKLAKGKLAKEKGKMKRARSEAVNDEGFVGKGKKKRATSAFVDDDDSGQEEEEERYEESDDFED